MGRLSLLPPIQNPTDEQLLAYLRENFNRIVDFLGGNVHAQAHDQGDHDRAEAGDLAAVAAAAAAGTSLELPNADHVHPHGTGYLADAHHAQSHNQTDHDAAEDGDIQDVGSSNAAGSSNEVAGAGHVHKHPNGLHGLILGPFAREDIVAGSTTTMRIGDTAVGLISAVMPYAGKIRAISIRVNAARTAGTLTVRPLVNGTADTSLEAQINATDTQQDYTTLAEGSGIAFAAGDILGMEYTATAAYAPTTGDPLGWLFVTFNII